MLIFADNTFWDNFYANLPAFLAAVFLFIQNLRNHKQNSSNIGHVRDSRLMPLAPARPRNWSTARRRLSSKRSRI